MSHHVASYKRKKHHIQASTITIMFYCLMIAVQQIKLDWCFWMNRDTEPSVFCSPMISPLIIYRTFNKRLLIRTKVRSANMFPLTMIQWSILQTVKTWVVSGLKNCRYMLIIFYKHKLGLTQFFSVFALCTNLLCSTSPSPPGLRKSSTRSLV